MKILAVTSKVSTLKSIPTQFAPLGQKAVWSCCASRTSIAVWVYSFVFHTAPSKHSSRSVTSEAQHRCLCGQQRCRCTYTPIVKGADTSDLPANSRSSCGGARYAPSAQTPERSLGWLQRLMGTFVSIGCGVPFRCQCIRDPLL